MPSFDLDRRAFLQATLAAGAATCVAPSPVVAQGRGDVLLLVQELGPNSLDMQGVGSNQTVNGLAWNCYDRLMTYAAKTLPDGTRVLRPRRRWRRSWPKAGRSPPTACRARSSCARTRPSTTARRSPPRT